VIVELVIIKVIDVHITPRDALSTPLAGERTIAMTCMEHSPMAIYVSVALC
jgi:hypothetical protein